MLSISLIASPMISQADHFDGTVMTVLITTASTVEARVENVLTDSALVFLERQGIEAVIADYELSDDEPTRRDISRLARDAGSDLILFGTFNQAEDSTTRLDISFSLYLVNPALPIATFQGEAEINLSLDRSVAGFLEILMDDAFAYLSETGEEIPSGSGTANGETTTGSDTATDVSGIVTGTENEGASPAAAPLIGTPDTLEVGGGYARAFAVAGASSYYQFAHGAGGYIRLIFGRRNGLGLGLTGSAVFVSATGVAADGELLIVPFAISTTIQSVPAPIGVYLTLGGGGALIQVSNPVLGTLAKLVPYATGGVGVKLALLGWVGMNAGVTFDAMFEGSVILTSFVPSVSLYVGF